MKGELRAFSLEGPALRLLCSPGGGAFPPAGALRLGAGGKAAPLCPGAAAGGAVHRSGRRGRDFTPWPAPGIREGEAFTGEAGDYLGFLTERALPLLERDFRATAQPQRRGILGYSLGGLFALWAQRQGEVFRLAGSLSGSLWYPGWLGYMEQHPPRPGACVYLSLGDREELGGPPLLRTVGDCTRRAHAFYKERGLDTTLEWNKGGHGKGVDTRWKKALRWAAGRLV